MNTKLLIYASAAAGLLYAATFQSTGQDAPDRSPVLTRQDRAAARKAALPQLSKLMKDLQAARQAAVETALASDAKDEDIRAKLEAVSKIQNEMALIWCKAVKQTVDLTGDQIERIRENPGLGYATLFNPATAYAAGRPGGRRGGNRGAANANSEKQP
jgi:hypothetical protein